MTIPDWGPGLSLTEATVQQDTELLVAALGQRIEATYRDLYYGEADPELDVELRLERGPLTITWGHPGMVVYPYPIGEQPEQGWTSARVDLGLDGSTLSAIWVWRGGSMNGIYRLRLETIEGPSLTLRFWENEGIRVDDGD